MRKLELNIKCCQDCPYMDMIGEGDDKHIGCRKINKKFGGGFAISCYTLYDCPLPSLMIIDAVEGDWPRPEKCPERGSFKIGDRQFDSIMPEGALLFFCGDCGEYF